MTSWNTFNVRMIEKDASQPRILLVEDDPELRQVFYSELSATQLSVMAMACPSQALKAFHGLKDYILVTDLDLGESLTGSHLAECLIHLGSSILALVVVTGRPNANEVLASTKTLCRERGLPFHLLEKPFGKGMLLNALRDITAHLGISIEGDQGQGRTTVQHLYTNSISYILKNARATIGVSEQEILDQLNSERVLISHSQYKAYEADASISETMPASLWVKLCGLLELPSDVLECGYAYKRHLRRLKVATHLKEFRLPVVDHLNFQLELLDQTQTADETLVGGQVAP